MKHIKMVFMAFEKIGDHQGILRIILRWTTLEKFMC